MIEAFGTASADQAPVAFVPASETEILERIPAAYAGLRADVTVTARSVTELIERGAAAGDARLLGRAEAAIAQHGATWPAAEAELARAWLLQHRHDFAGALQILNTLAEQRRLPAAFAMRAQIHLVQGDLAAAQRDCAALLIAEPSAALLCAAQLAARRGDFAGAASLLERWLSENPAGSSVQLRVVLVRSAELAHLRQDHRLAQQRFTAALALAPYDVRTLAAYSRVLRAQGGFAEVLALLEADPQNDTLLLERTLAAHALHANGADALSARLSARHALLRTRGETPELREQAEFTLDILGQPQRALELAIRNFQTQRDREDVDILLRAAAATGDTSVLEMVHAWAEQQGVAMPGSNRP